MMEQNFRVCWDHDRWTVKPIPASQYPNVIELKISNTLVVDITLYPDIELSKESITCAALRRGMTLIDKHQNPAWRKDFGQI